MLQTRIKQWLAGVLARSPRRVAQVRKLARYLSPQDTILLDYPVEPRPRWTAVNPHAGLRTILDRGRASYRTTLESFACHVPALSRIRTNKQEAGPEEPCWINGGWIPALDGVALYGFMAGLKPGKYFEIGSGYSTRFACKAKKDKGLKTEILSIDPHPRAEIDTLCDRVIRRPLECVDLELFKELGENDILYIDNSHRAFMNSDVTVALLEVLPLLAEGVVVAVHDIFLPFDYPATWAERYYSEQYVLAAYLLAEGPRLKVLFPAIWISSDKELHGILDPLWCQPALQGAEFHGCSFWMRIGRGMRR